MEAIYEHAMQVRYMEADAQGVVFNGWYLTYFDEAFTGFLGARGLDYATLVQGGADVQLVRTEVDWRTGLHWPDVFRVQVSVARYGRTSLAVDFTVVRDPADAGHDGDEADVGEVTCSGRTVYVVVATDGSGKQPVPQTWRDALGEARPLRDG